LTSMTLSFSENGLTCDGKRQQELEEREEGDDRDSRGAP